MVVAMNAVTQAKSAVLAGDRRRARDLAHLAATTEQVDLARRPQRTWAGSPWNWNGPGLTSGVSVQSTGNSVATMSSTFTRHGVPSMISLQPSQRVATLSLTIVRMSTPMISIASDGSRGLAGGAPKGIRTPDLHLERVAS